jgi:hypothetical protein
MYKIDRDQDYTQADKRISLLNNPLFNEWKERVRQHQLLIEKPIVNMMISE